ncbi:HNH endonuclease family protein [Actinoplanes bogorensis]|uniref:HNH endonuclease family protein n=1 Tax=Paractinoplanes bogorensis TaxID=1610840 RepID=A0ABS5YQU2_9ACTN|nr:HNH endonuclease family protein [Actinoplanes bogorensis]MBU2665088.1 HNH endonuclease family protein [Actinoplanes bogorensis]
MRRLSLLVAAVVAIGLATAAPASATPPNIPSATTAQSQLNALTVATQGSMSGYSRDLFPHWITISGACNTRETVLKRDGSNVVTNSSCASTSGSWYSPYDGVTWSAASDVDIDHIVPLAEAWRSGASSWTTSKRQSFANDLTRPQLIAVTDNVNQSKGDQDPSTWVPSRTAYRCTYARMWIGVKYYWNLTLQSAEKTALQNLLTSYC